VITLTDGLGVTAAAEGARAFHAHYAKAPFAGREAELAALEDWRASDDRFALLVAEAGSGKSALLARWADQLAGQGVRVVWAPVSLRFGTSRGSAVRGLIEGRLRVLGVKAAVGDFTDALRARGDDVVVIVDGVDEAQDEELIRDLSSLATAKTVKLLVSARTLVDRDAVGWARHLGWSDARLVSLGPLDRAGLAALLGEPALPATVLTELVRITQGNALLARLLVEREGGAWIRRASVSLATEALGTLREGLDGIFDSWWRDQESAWAAMGDSGRHRESIDAVLAALATALAPVPVALLVQVVQGHVEQRAESVSRSASASAGVDDVGEGVRNALSALGRFVVHGKSEEITFAHPRLSQYFLERLSQGERAAWNRAHLAVTRAWADRVVNASVAPRDVPEYVLSTHCAYLTRCDSETAATEEGFFDELDALVVPAWLDAWEALEGGATGFSADVRAVWSRVDQAVARPRTTAARALLLARQVHYRALLSLLVVQEGELSAMTRAELVRHGLRGQRAAIASLASIVDVWRHKQAVARLLEVLDRDGAYSLIALGDPQSPRFPHVDVARKLVALGDLVEAQRWLTGIPDPARRLAAIAEAFAAFPETERPALREATSATAEALNVSDDDGADAMEELCAAAGVLDVPRRDALLARLEVGLSSIPEHKLYFDDYEGSVDPRILLANAFTQAGSPGRAQRWLDAALAWPVPFDERPAQSQGASAGLVSAFVAAALAANAGGASSSDLANALAAGAQAAADRTDRTLGAIQLLPLAPDRTTAFERVLDQVRAREDEALALYAALAGAVECPEQATAAADALCDRVVELVGRFCAAPDTAGAAVNGRYAFEYALSQRGPQAIEAVAPYASPAAAGRAAEALCFRFGRGAHTITQRAHIVYPVAALAMRLLPPDRDRIAASLFEDAQVNPGPSSMLADLPEWRALFSEA
jgi:hypothetical protein